MDLLGEGGVAPPSYDKMGGGGGEGGWLFFINLNCYDDMRHIAHDLTVYRSNHSETNSDLSHNITAP